MSYKESILKLKQEGKSQKEISEILGCTESNVSYHCGSDKSKNGYTLRNRIYREKLHPYAIKLKVFMLNR